MSRPGETEHMHGDLTQAEKHDTLENGRSVRKGGTYFEFAASEAGAARGRYGVISKTQVTGASPISQYPSQPPGSPWHDEPCGIEPPFPIDIGPAAAHEIEKSWPPKQRKRRHHAAK